MNKEVNQILFVSFIVGVLGLMFAFTSFDLKSKNKELQKQLDYQKERGILLQISYENAYYEKTQTYPPYECYAQ